MTHNIDRADQAMESACCGGCCGPCDFPRLARALAAAGLLAPEPQIIRTREELAALDPDTLVTSRIPVHDAWPGCQVMAFPAPAAHRLDLTWCGPMVVIATGEQVRTARQALESGE